MIKRHRLILVIAFLITLAILTSPAMAFKDFRGKVIDADTKEPIEGAVVTAIWTREVKHINVTRDIFKEARETLTDKNGEFSIKPYHHYSLRPLSKLRLSWIIYKPSYASFAPLYYTWHPKTRPSKIPDRIFRPYTVVELPKLKTKEERKKYLRGNLGTPSSIIPVEKIPLLMRAINIEHIELGFKPYDIEGLKRIQKEQKEEVYDKKGRLKKRGR